MKRYFIFFILNIVFFNSSASSANDFWRGRWEYTGFQYQGRYFTKPNPYLHVIFDFQTNNLLNLNWYRTDDPLNCQRLAEYKIEKRILYQKIIWVNPNNSMSCAQDPDMQIGRESYNRIEKVGSQLYLYLELSGEEFIYILDSFNENKGQNKDE